MPVAAGVGIPDVAAVLDDVRHHQDPRVTGKRILVEGVDLGRPEALAEGELAFRAQPLFAEDEHAEVGEGTVNLGKDVIGQRPREVEPGNFRPRTLPARTDVEPAAGRTGTRR